jgi:DNA-binding CsgD family transcriptional regulator
MEKDDEWQIINQNFDIVYENFTKRLMELHPGLSAADKRMCCYIKMGLSSKEIAPLLNISYKSVEMARYRLRKKMNIEGSMSLTDYLANIQ